VRAPVTLPRWSPDTTVRRVLPRPFCRNHGAGCVLERTPVSVGVSLWIIQVYETNK